MLRCGNEIHEFSTQYLFIDLNVLVIRAGIEILCSDTALSKMCVQSC